MSMSTKGRLAVFYIAVVTAMGVFGGLDGISAIQRATGISGGVAIRALIGAAVGVLLTLVIVLGNYWIRNEQQPGG